MSLSHLCCLDEACLIVVPALLGLTRAMQGGVVSRREAFWQLFQGEQKGVPEGERKGGQVGERGRTGETGEEMTFGVEATEKLIKLVRKNIFLKCDRKLSIFPIPILHSNVFSYCNLVSCPDVHASMQRSVCCCE